MYRFRLSVELPNGKRAVSCFDVDGMMARYLEPIDVCTDHLVARAVGGKTLHQAQRIQEDRAGVAREISAKLTEAILKTIIEQDTENGYAKEAPKTQP